MQQPSGGGYYAAPYVSYAPAQAQQPVYAQQPAGQNLYKPPYSPVHGASDLGLGYDAALAPPAQHAPHMYAGAAPAPSYGSMVSAQSAYSGPQGGQLRYAGGAVVGAGGRYGVQPQPIYTGAPPGGAPGLRPALSFRSEYSHATAASYGGYSAYPQQQQQGAAGGRYVTSAEAQGYAQGGPHGSHRSASVPVSPSRVSSQLQTQRERSAAQAKRKSKPVRDRFGYKPKQEVDKEKMNQRLVTDDKSQLLFSKKPRRRAYNPYTLEDFKRIQPKKYMELGSLQPNLNTEEHRAKVAKAEKVREYAERQRALNAARLLKLNKAKARRRARDWGDSPEPSAPTSSRSAPGSAAHNARANRGGGGGGGGGSARGRPRNAAAAADNAGVRNKRGSLGKAGAASLSIGGGGGQPPQRARQRPPQHGRRDSGGGQVRQGRRPQGGRVQQYEGAAALDGSDGDDDNDGGYSARSGYSNQSGNNRRSRDDYDVYGDDGGMYDGAGDMGYQPPYAGDDVDVMEHIPEVEELAETAQGYGSRRRNGAHGGGRRQGDAPPRGGGGGGGGVPGSLDEFETHAGVAAGAGGGRGGGGRGNRASGGARGDRGHQGFVARGSVGDYADDDSLADYDGDSGSEGDDDDPLLRSVGIAAVEARGGGTGGDDADSGNGIASQSEIDAIRREFGI